MNKYGITIQKLAITGNNIQAAEITLMPGLNVVTGLSNTGKSYILQCIDFMLGAQTPPKTIDESKHYTTAFLQIKDRENKIYTLERSLQGGAFRLHNHPIGEIDQHQPVVKLKPKSDSNNTDNISSFILSLIGIPAIKIKTNSSNKTENLSFRTISHLFLVNETDIISESSPLEPKNTFERTKLKSAFKFLITGQDDSSLIESTDPKIAKARLTAQIEIYDRLILELEQSLKSQTKDSSSVKSKLQEIEANISQLSSRLSESNAEIVRYQQTRQNAWIEQQEANSRLIAIDEVLRRFDLLQEHYQSDLRRLDFTSEGDHYFGQLEPVFCPFCGTPLEKHTAQMMCVERQGELVDIQTACREESAKLNNLLRDLEQAKSSLRREREEKRFVEQKNRGLVSEAETYITRILQPNEIIDRKRLEELELAYKGLAEIEINNQRLLDLREARAALQRSSDASTDKGESSSQLDTVALRSLCESIEDLLRSWKYPDVGTVEFDQKDMDILIKGKRRRSNGKGVRAVTHSAFNIGLMHYCKKANLPHPYFLILDSPLTTFKENRGDTINDETSGEIQEAFFENLSHIGDEEQIIILENKTPPSRIRNSINIIEFTGREGSGRQGFIPNNP